MPAQGGLDGCDSAFDAKLDTSERYVDLLEVGQDIGQPVEADGELASNEPAEIDGCVGKAASGCWLVDSARICW